MNSLKQNLDNALDSLEKDGNAIASLAAAYYTDDALTGREFYINLSIASGVSDSDAVIFDQNGKLILCSDSPFGCPHQGWTVNREYLQLVFNNGLARHTGMFSGLYNENRYVVSVPIRDARNCLRVITRALLWQKAIKRFCL